MDDTPPTRDQRRIAAREERRAAQRVATEKFRAEAAARAEATGPAKDWPTRFKRFFHWQYSGVLIPFLIGSGLAMIAIGLALEEPELIKDAFWLAYLLLAAGFVWAIAYWLTSDFIQHLRAAQATTNRAWWKYCGWQWSVSLGLVILFSAVLFFTHRMEQTRELSIFVGKVVPANDPITGACGGASGNEAVLLVRTTAYKIGRWPQTILTVRGKPRIVMERDSNGAIALTAQVFSVDGKIITEVVRNAFNINKNNVFRMERPDSSTIAIFDQNNDRAVYLRFRNPHEIEFDAKLYYRDYGDVNIFNRTYNLCVDVTVGVRSIFSAPPDAGSLFGIK